MSPGRLHNSLFPSGWRASQGTGLFVSSQHEADELTHYSSHICDMALGEAEWGPVLSFSIAILKFFREQFQPNPLQNLMGHI